MDGIHKNFVNFGLLELAPEISDASDEGCRRCRWHCEVAGVKPMWDATNV